MEREGEGICAMLKTMCSLSATRMKPIITEWDHEKETKESDEQK